MNLNQQYLGHSGLRKGPSGQVLEMEPNLSREPVAFDALLLKPLRFREAISALHDIVINDLKYKPRDKTAYENWQAAQRKRETAIRQAAYGEARKELEARKGKITKELEKEYRSCKSKYWKARSAYNRILQRKNQSLWRQLMPYDPVITVADDVAFFECFSADESSYGCLSVNREDGFGHSNEVKFGTTNVDYSWALYDQFQSLRTYRETRFRIDPQGFEVATEGNPDYREEKIDLPESWLSGFLQIQNAMTMPMRHVPLSKEAVYSILAWLKNHRARTSPRALRFECMHGQSPSVVLEPWEKKITSYGTRYTGPDSEPIRIWGRRRLQVLARVLPLAERVDVFLLGHGLPSFWVVRMGEMSLTLGLSGWTSNDWTRSSALDMLAPPQSPSEFTISSAAQTIQEKRAISLSDVMAGTLATPGEAAAALNHLARTGQVIYDLTHQTYRQRQIMPFVVGEQHLGPPHPELQGCQNILAKKKIKLNSREAIDDKRVLVSGKSEGYDCELIMDQDGLIKRGKCECSYHYKNGIRKGPCRHLQALRSLAIAPQAEQDKDTKDWFQRLNSWAGR